MTDKEIINLIIAQCNYSIRLVKENSDYFSDDFDYDMIEWFTTIRKLIMKLSNQNKKNNLKK